MKTEINAGVLKRACNILASLSDNSVWIVGRDNIQMKAMNAHVAMAEVIAPAKSDVEGEVVVPIYTFKDYFAEFDDTQTVLFEYILVEGSHHIKVSSGRSKYKVKVGSGDLAIPNLPKIDYGISTNNIKLSDMIKLVNSVMKFCDTNIITISCEADELRLSVNSGWITVAYSVMATGLDAKNQVDATYLIHYLRSLKRIGVDALTIKTGYDLPILLTPEINGMESSLLVAPCVETTT